MKTVWKGSPNFWQGRGHGIDRVVLHWIVGTLATADSVFENAESQVSAHYGIEGTTIHQYVSEDDTAWHAGTGPMNARSIGIEHSAAPGRPASAKTVDTSARLVAAICKRHKIPCDRKHIIKHSEVIATQCPGTIPIDDIIKKANAIMRGEEVGYATAQDVAVYYRIYYGEGPSDWAKKNVVGKMTTDELYKIILKSDGYKNRIKLAAAGKLKAENHLPMAYRDAYKPPAPPEFEEVKEPLYRKK